MIVAAGRNKAQPWTELRRCWVAFFAQYRSSSLAAVLQSSRGFVGGGGN